MGFVREHMRAPSQGLGRGAMFSFTRFMRAHLISKFWAAISSISWFCVFLHCHFLPCFSISSSLDLLGYLRFEINPRMDFICFLFGMFFWLLGAVVWNRSKNVFSISSLFNCDFKSHWCWPLNGASLPPRSDKGWACELRWF